MPHNNSYTSTRGTEQLWTRAKCNRLLRPLTLALSSQAAKRTAEPDALHGFPNGQGPVDRHSKDASWFNGASKKQQRLTYGRSSRYRLAANSRLNQASVSSVQTRPGEIVPPTPLLNKVRENVTSQNRQPNTTMDNSWDVYTAPRSPDDPSSRSQKWNSIEAVKVAFKNLLAQTKPALDPTQSAHGAPSFLSLCLRNIPAHIADEQEWRRAQDPDDKSDVSAEVYEYLEGLGCDEQEGWRHLRSVVRAHGVSLVQTYIRSQNIGDADVRALIKICIQEDCPDEARRLCRCWIDSRDPFSLPSSPNTSELFLFDLLNLLTNADYNPVPQYRMLEILLKRRALPLAWITTPAFRSTWHKIIVSSSQDDEESVAAVEVINRILSLATDIDVEHPKMPFTASWSGQVALEDKTTSEQQEIQAAITNTVFSLCTIVSSISCLKLDLASDDVVDGSQSHEVEAIAFVTRAIREAVLPHHGLLEHASVTANRLIVCAAHMFLTLHNIGCESRTPLTVFDEALSSLIRMNVIYNKCHKLVATSNEFVSSFLCAVMRCFGRVQGQLAFELLKRSARKMISFRPRNEDPLRKPKLIFIRCLALDIVVRFAECSQQPEHIQFQHALEKLMGGSNIPSGNKGSPSQYFGSSSTTNHGLRWEEGICEWVAATPASLLRTVRLPSFPTSSPPQLNTSPPFEETPTKQVAKSTTPTIHKPTPVAPAKSKRAKTSHTARADSSSSFDSSNKGSPDPIVDSGVLMADQRDSFKVARQQPAFMQTFIEDESDEEDELALPAPAPPPKFRMGQHKTILGLGSPTSKARAYSGVRDGNALAKLNITELTSDELG